MLKELWCESVDWIHLAQDRVHWRVVVNTVMKLRGPQKAVNFLTLWVTIRFPGRALLHRDS